MSVRGRTLITDATGNVRREQSPLVAAAVLFRDLDEPLDFAFIPVSVALLFSASVPVKVRVGILIQHSPRVISSLFALSGPAVSRATTV